MILMFSSNRFYFHLGTATEPGSRLRCAVNVGWLCEIHSCVLMIDWM